MMYHLLMALQRILLIVLGDAGLALNTLMYLPKKLIITLFAVFNLLQQNVTPFTLLLK